MEYGYLSLAYLWLSNVRSRNTHVFWNCTNPFEQKGYFVNAALLYTPLYPGNAALCKFEDVVNRPNKQYKKTRPDMLLAQNVFEGQDHKYNLMEGINRHIKAQPAPGPGHKPYMQVGQICKMIADLNLSVGF